MTDMKSRLDDYLTCKEDMNSRLDDYLTCKEEKTSNGTRKEEAEMEDDTPQENAQMGNQTPQEETEAEDDTPLEETETEDDIRQRRVFAYMDRQMEMIRAQTKSLGTYVEFKAQHDAFLKKHDEGKAQREALGQVQR